MNPDGEDDILRVMQQELYKWILQGGNTKGVKNMEKYFHLMSMVCRFIFSWKPATDIKAKTITSFIDLIRLHILLLLFDHKVET